ncbi:glycosyl transferase family 1, partial [Photobacterium sp. GB-27]|uniref:hypothetical protein n=1 Tax=Photobacterium sp. GB-27 TaxID=2022109 RepID=UPI000D4E9EF1
MENKVVFDLISLQESPDSKFHGGGEYAKNIFFSLIENKRNFICIYSNKLHLENLYIDVCKRNNIELVGIDSKYDIYKIMCRDDISAFYSAIPYDYYDVNFNGKKVIITIHGLRDIECPSDSFEYIY